jgi:outer membrane receptor for Fe3+-dicitrate
MGATIVGMVIITVGIQPALAQEAEEPKSTEEEGIAGELSTEEEEETPEQVTFTGEIEVKGYRQSLQQSVELKRDAINARDSIVVEDIGKMPDLNLAEAIQRVPGVAIVREGGEGRQMSLRGLGPEFTRVTERHGMPASASTAPAVSSGSVLRLQRLPRRLFTDRCQ